MSWRDELKAEIGDLQTAIRVDAGITKDSPPMIVMGTPKHLAELCALILELIDHIPEEQETKPLGAVFYELLPHRRCEWIFRLFRRQRFYVGNKAKMKPKAAELPPKSGYYWVKTAARTWVAGERSWTWDNPHISGWEPVEYDARLNSYDEIGSDENGEWDTDWHCVVDWQPLEPPNDDPRWVHSDAGAKIGFEGYSGHESEEK